MPLAFLPGEAIEQIVWQAVEICGGIQRGANLRLTRIGAAILATGCARTGKMQREQRDTA